MLVPADSLLIQFKDKIKLLGLANAHADQYNEIEYVLDKFINAYALSTAVGNQLDAIGFLLGFERPITRDLDKYFTFQGGVGKGFGNRFGTIDGGVLIGYSDDGLALADDAEYRNLLYIKLFSNLSKNRPNDLINIVNKITGTSCIYKEDYNTEIANCTIQVLGGGDDEFKTFLENFLSKPLGVSLTIEAYPITDVAIEGQTYAGNSLSQNLTTVSNVTKSLAFIKNVTSVADGMFVTTVAGESKAISINNTDAFKDIGVQYMYENSVTITGDSIEANNSGDTYTMFNINMPKREAVQTSDSLTAEYILNEATGFTLVTWYGSGSDEQHIRVPFNRPVSLMMGKCLDGGDMTVVGALIPNEKMTINTDLPPIPDPDPDLRLLSAGIAVSGLYNKLDAYYIGFIINENIAYSVINSYKSTGTLQFAISVGFEPQIIIIKRYDTNGDWLYFASDLMGVSHPKSIRMNSDQPAIDDNLIEFTADGFKLLTNDTNTNQDTGEYFYIAIRG